MWTSDFVHIYFFLITKIIYFHHKTLKNYFLEDQKEENKNHPTKKKKKSPLIPPSWCMHSAVGKITGFGIGIPGFEFWHPWEIAI